MGESFYKQVSLTQGQWFYTSVWGKVVNWRVLFERICHGWRHVNFGDLKKLENLFQCIEDLIFKCATCVYFSIYIQCWSNHPLSSTKFQKANLWPRLFQTMFRMLNFSIIKERISHRWRHSSFRDRVISWLFFLYSPSIEGSVTEIASWIKWTRCSLSKIFVKQLLKSFKWYDLFKQTISLQIW